MNAHSGERLGPYLLREQLGEGGMGVVYLASDPAGSLVAVKVLRQGVPAEAAARHRLAREVATMRRVQSPFVAEVVDADVEGDQPYIVTRYVAGRTLDDVVAAAGPLTGPALANLASGLAAALVAVHEAGVVHRDLKPGNVMLVDGQPVVIDFGIAQAADSTRLTMTGMFMGTPGYLAPEVIEGKPSGPAADVHSWAATMAYAASGKPPFGTGQFETIFYRIVHGHPELDGIPAPLLPILRAALARDPSLRPSSAELAQLAADLKPETLLPAPAGAAVGAGPGDLSDPAGLSGQATHTALDVAPQLPAAGLPAAGLPAAGLPAAGLPAAGLPAAQGWPGTRPIAARPQDDFADLLTPVRAGSPGRGQLPGGQASPRAAARSASQSGRLPLVLATLAALVAIAVLLPVAGAAAALAVLVLLRAADVTSGWLTRRRSRQGPRPGDAMSATAFYPLAVCRSVLSSVLLAPMALLCAAVVAVLAVLASGTADLPRAGGYAAGALVACYCIGPGSRACRRPLSQFYRRVLRSTPAAIIGSLGIAAMVAGVAVAAATTTPGYWPDWHLGNQLQTASFSHPDLNHLSGNVTELGRRLVHWLGRL